MQQTAVGAKGFESFTSEPFWFYEPFAEKKVELEEQAVPSPRDYINYSGNGFVEVSTKKHKEILLRVNVEQAGEYLVDFHYSNGNGPWNTGNKAAIRSLYANGDYVGAVVFPQRGQDKWSDWGLSNSFSLRLQEGQNHLQLRFEQWNNNMNVGINEAMLDYMRMIRLD